jgi:hypothetical protein
VGRGRQSIWRPGGHHSRIRMMIFDSCDLSAVYLRCINRTSLATSKEL